MKKIYLLLFSITLVSGVINAKGSADSIIDFRDKLMFGLKAGVNYSNVYDAQGEQFNADPKFGFVGGVFLEIPIGKYLGVQPEVLFSQKGFQATGNLLSNAYTITRTTSFIDIPLFIAFKPSEFLTILAGPQYSYLMKQRDTFTNSNSSVAQEKEFSNDDIRKNIMSFAGGIDFTLRHLVIGGRVAWDVQTNNSNGAATTPRYKNVWYQTTIGFRF